MDWIEFDKQQPKDDKLFILTNGAFAEIVYIHNKELKKPWRYSDNDTPTFSYPYKGLKWTYLELPV